MRVRVTESFNTAKGNIPENTIIDIPEAMFDRLKGKVTKIPLAVKKIEPVIKHPVPEGRRKSLEMIADAILEQTVIDINYGGIWQSTPNVKALEDEINRLYQLLMEGLSTIQAFREIVNQWKATGTQTTKH
jgi:fido (protein-threonine AMPylation protein)